MVEFDSKQLRTFLMVQLTSLSCVLFLLVTEERLAQIVSLAIQSKYNILLLVLSMSLIMLSTKYQTVRQWLIGLNLLGLIFTFFMLLFILVLP